MPIKYSSEQLKEIIAEKRKALASLSMNPAPHAVLQEFKDMEARITQMKANTSLDNATKVENINNEISAFAGSFGTLSSAMQDTASFERLETNPQLVELNKTLSEMSVALPKPGAPLERAKMVDVLRLPGALESLVEIYAICLQNDPSLDSSILNEVHKFNRIAADPGLKWRFASVTKALDKIASALEEAGHKDLAAQVDVVSNTLEHGLTPQDMLDQTDKAPMHDILEALKSETDSNQLVKFFESPVAFLQEKMHIDENSPVWHAAAAIASKIADLTRHLRGGAHSLAMFGWEGARQFLDREFGGRVHLASSANFLGNVSQQLLKGVAAEITEALKSMHPLTGAYGSVPEEILHAAVKGGLDLATLLEALKDPQTLADDLSVATSNSISQAPGVPAAPEMAVAPEVQAIVAL